MKATNLSKEIVTPYYENGFYINNVIRCWRIISEKQKILFHVMDSYLEFQTSCLNDFGIIYDGHDNNSRLKKRWCGFEKNFNITTGKEAYIEFISDGNNLVGRGFKIEFYILPEKSKNDEKSKNITKISVVVLSVVFTAIIIFTNISIIIFIHQKSIRTQNTSISTSRFSQDSLGLTEISEQRYFYLSSDSEPLPTYDQAMNQQAKFYESPPPYNELNKGQI